MYIILLSAQQEIRHLKNSNGYLAGFPSINTGFTVYTRKRLDLKNKHIPVASQFESMVCSLELVIVKTYLNI